MRSRLRLRSLTFLAIGACGAGACTNFQNPTTVVDLRILAVTTNPSEIILNADLSNPLMPIVDPASNPEVTVTPLIVDPHGNGRMVRYSISACPNDPFAPAPPGGGQGGGAFPSGGARTTVGSALCDENSDTTWPLVDPTDMNLPAKVHPDIDQLKTAFMRDIFPDQYGNLHGGFDLGMPLTLDIKVETEDGEQIRGVKRVLYWAQRIDDQQMPNQIPTIDELDLFYERDPATFDPVDTPQIVKSPDPNMPDLPFVVDRPGTKLWIRPSKGDAESFETTVVDPDTHRAVPFTVARETLRYRFFATAGTFAPPVTSSEPDTGFVATGPIHIESEYSPPGPGTIATDTDGRAEITIWVVVRDDRGGESWATRKLLITP